jgi:hypothetical protein
LARLHDDEAGALQMFEALRHDRGQDLVGVVNAFAACFRGAGGLLELGFDFCDRDARDPGLNLKSSMVG